MRAVVLFSLLLCACSTDTFATSDGGDAGSDVVTGPDAPSFDGGPQPCTCTGESVCKSGVCVAPMTADACLVASGEYVYWTNGQTIASGGAVYRMKIADGTVEIVAAGQEVPRAIAADDTHLYWAAIGAIRSAPFGSNVQPATVTATNHPATAIGVTNGMLFYGQDDGFAFSVSAKGGAPATIGGNGVAAYMHAAGGRMYWTASDPGDAGNGYIESAPLDGGFAKNEFALPGAFTGFDVNTNVVTTYKVAYPSKDQIFSLVNSNLPIVKASEPDDLALDSSSFLYWSERRDGGAIMKYDNDASTVVSKADYPHCIAIVEPSIYWTAPGLVVPGVSGL